MRAYETTLRDELLSTDQIEQIAAVRRAAKHRRADLLPELVQLLRSDKVGYFVEEVLPQFGEAALPALRELLHDEAPGTSRQARYRVAGLLARLGEREAIPVLLQAIGQVNTNQGYFALLARLAPEELRKRLLLLIREKSFAMFVATEPRTADYFAKLILTLRDLHGQSDIAPLLEGLRAGAKDWRVRAAAEAALAPE